MQADAHKRLNSMSEMIPHDDNDYKPVLDMEIVNVDLELNKKTMTQNSLTSNKPKYTNYTQQKTNRHPQLRLYSRYV